MGSTGNLSTKDRTGNPPRPSKAFLDVLRKHLAEHYRQPVSKLSTAVYAQDLAKLSAEELDAACTRARQTSEFMPVSAAILKAHEELAASGVDQFLGVPQLEYPPVTQEDRDAGLEYSEKLKKQLGIGEKAPAAPQKKLKIVQSTRTIEEQKEILRKRGLL